MKEMGQLYILFFFGNPFLPLYEIWVHHLQIPYVGHPVRARYGKTIMHPISHEMGYAEPLFSLLPVKNGMSQNLSRNGGHGAWIVQKSCFDVWKGEPRSTVVSGADQEVVHGGRRMSIPVIWSLSVCDDLQPRKERWQKLDVVELISHLCTFLEHLDCFGTCGEHLWAYQHADAVQDSLHMVYALDELGCLSRL